MRDLAPPERAAWVVVAAAVLVFGILLALVPAFFISFDEAKYLGIGANLWHGNGPRTVFGLLFLPHAPLWSATLFAPQALFGIDAVSWGHLLNALAGMSVIVLAGVLGGWSRPAAGALAACLVLCFTYLQALSRTARLDVPAAALALLYLVVGWRAVRSGSVRWSVAAGGVFAIAVLVKEIAIPLAPVPILCAVLAGFEWRRILRVAGWTTVAAAIGLAPWFLYYAAQTGRVYRLDTPAWTLVPITLGLAGVVTAGLAADRLAASPRLTAFGDRLRNRIPAALARHDRDILGWGLTLAWSGVWLLFFANISRLQGASIFDPAQLHDNLRLWFRELWPIGLVVAPGILFAVVLIASDRECRECRGVVNNLVTTICSAPFVLMVVAVGEPPRNYIAQVAVAAALAAAAWLWAIDRFVTRLARHGRLPRFRRWFVPSLILLALLIGSGAAAVRARLTSNTGGVGRDPAIRTAVAWIRDHVPPGTPIAFGSFLSYEMAYQLVPDYPTHQIPARLVSTYPSMPLGLGAAYESPSDAWLAVDVQPRNVNQYLAFRAVWIESAIARFRIGYWVYSSGESTASPTIRAQLTPAHGFVPVATWDIPRPGTPITVTIYRVDLDHVALDRSRLYISPEALHRLVTQLAKTPETSRAAAKELVEHIIAEPPSAGASADLERLRALAGP